MVFHHAASSDDAKTWIDDMVLHKAPCSMVIWIQTLSIADFKRVLIKEGVEGGYVSAPLEATAHIPVHINDEVSAHHFSDSVARTVDQDATLGFQIPSALSCAPNYQNSEQMPRL